MMNTDKENSAQRRARLRLERGLIGQEEYERQCERILVNERPLTDAEWRYIGQCNGRVF